MASHKFLKKIYEKNFKAKRSRAGRIVKHQHMDVIQSRKDYKGDQSPYWDYVRASTRSIEGEYMEPYLANPDMLPEKEQSMTYPAMVRTAQGHLSGQQRRVFDLIVEEGDTIPHTAQRLGIAPGTVRSHLQAIRRRLKKVFPSWNY